MIAVGVDPGGANTGIVVCDNDDLFWSLTETRSRNEPIHQYAYRVLHTLDAALAEARDAGNGTGIVAVEAVTAPNPHVNRRRKDGTVTSLTNPRGAIDTAVIFGAVIAHIHGQPVIVQPGGHGSHPLSGYPVSLRPTRGRGQGRDSRRHVRSAFDIAQAGIVQRRMAAIT